VCEIVVLGFVSMGRTKASSLKPQASSLKPQASSLKPQAEILLLFILVRRQDER